MEEHQDLRFKVILKRTFSQLNKDLRHALQSTFNNNEQTLRMNCKDSFCEKSAFNGRLKS